MVDEVTDSIDAKDETPVKPDMGITVERAMEIQKELGFGCVVVYYDTEWDESYVSSIIFWFYHAPDVTTDDDKKAMLKRIRAAFPHTKWEKRKDSYDGGHLDHVAGFGRTAVTIQKASTCRITGYKSEKFTRMVMKPKDPDVEMVEVEETFEGTKTPIYDCGPG